MSLSEKLMQLRGLRMEVERLIQSFDLDALSEDDLVLLGNELWKAGGDIRAHTDRVKDEIRERLDHMEPGRHVVNGSDGRSQCSLTVSGPKLRIKHGVNHNRIHDRIPLQYRGLFHASSRIVLSKDFRRQFENAPPGVQSALSALVDEHTPPIRISFLSPRHQKR